MIQVSFATRKLQKACESEKSMRAEWGAKMAAKIAQRIVELENADNLEVIAKSRLGRFHEYDDGRMTLDLVQPYRLVFVPDHAPIPRKADGGVDLVAVTSVLIVDICDPH